jgi:2-keto-4-pentenoate hydratase/2-oxohepta-3-ene-1,7-dioic acid hydratase in catechol pathway
MKYVRYQCEGRTSYGILDGERIEEIDGGLFGARAKTGRFIDSEKAELLWPCEPTKIMAVGLNYKSHLENRSAPARPEIFFKPPTALLKPGGEIVIPGEAQDLHFEGELVAVIGKAARNVSPAEAESCILGFTCGNDVSERYWQKNDLQWWRAKGCDTFAPLGPVIVTGFDWRQGKIETRVNGAVKQSGNFSELLFNPLEIVSHISRHLTLLPGDVVYTGTPGHTSKLKPGDVIEVEIEGLGILRNRVIPS